MPDDLTEEERALVEAHLAAHGVTVCPPGLCALDLDEIAPGVDPGRAGSAQERRQYLRSRWILGGTVRAWARERVEVRERAAVAALTFGSGLDRREAG